MPQVIYIMGSGRSGSTVLEILLANNPQIAGVGEVTHIFRDGFIDNVDCSCGHQMASCSLWSAVARHCNWGSKDFENLARLFHYVSWHSRFPILAAGLMPMDVMIQYKSVNACLFSAASFSTEASLIVDSSKYAGRALALVKLFPDDVRVICLTRSPASLVSAFNKTDAGEQKPKSLLAVFLYYIYTLACFRVVAWKLGSRLLKITYEDIMTRPVETLEKIGRWSGQDLGQVISAVRNARLLEVGHIVTGNRLRKQGKIQFTPQVAKDYQAGFLGLRYSLADEYVSQNIKILKI